MNNLNEEEKQNLKSILNISYSILDNYLKLRNLEIKGEKNSEEYKTVVNSLNTTLLLETSLYKKINVDNIDAYINFVSKGENLVDIKNDINAAKNRGFDNLVKRRVINRIIEMKYEYNKENFDYGNICVEIKNDVIKTIMTILNLYLNNPKYQNITKELLNFKYNLAFLNKNMEEDLLEHEFSINPDLYLTTYLITDMYNIKRELVDIFKISFSSNILNSELEFILDQDNTSLRNKENYAKSIMAQILIRVAILFGANNLRDDLKEHFEQFKEFTISKDGEIDGEKLVLEALDFYDRDREIPKIVSLKI